MIVSDEDVFKWLKKNEGDDLKTLSAMQQYKVSPEQIARVAGLDIGNVNSRIEGLVNQVYQDQFGRGANSEEVVGAQSFLNGGGLVDVGIGNLNRTQDAYNYDTNDIIAAYRETFGRNPTQEEYVGAMATLGIENFDRASLGDSGKYTAATVAALESDPYAGRFAGYNPYKLPADAANVSENILGDKVQYISPITQRPVISSFDDGELELSEGLDVLTPQQVESALGLATATGGLTPKQLQMMNSQLKDANTIDDVYSAFSDPQAVASLGKNGQQTGVGETYEDAIARGFGGVDMDGLYKALYKDAAPYKTSDTMPAGALQPTAKQNLLNSTQLGVQQGLNLKSSLQDPNKLQNLGVFGAAGNERMGAGGADYQSDLIQSLREADNGLKSNNAGVTKYNFLGAATPAAPGERPLNAGGSLTPGVLAQDSASTDDIANWNKYSAYRTNSLQNKTPIVSFQDWLAGGKTDGKPASLSNQIYAGGGDYNGAGYPGRTDLASVESMGGTVEGFANADSGGMFGGAQSGDVGFASGGMVTKDRLHGPDPAGPDDGYGALDDGEFVLTAKAVKELGPVGVELLRRLNARDGK